MDFLNAKTPSELRELMSKYPYPDAVGKAILHHKDTPIDVLLKHTHCSGIVSSIYLPLEVYDKLLDENNKDILAMACRVGHTPSIVLEKIYKLHKEDFEIQFDLCRSADSKISADMLHELSKSQHWEIRAYVAKHNNTEIRDIVSLQQDKEPRVLIALRDKFVKQGILESEPKANWRDVPKLKIA
jgi:hypothetical protein